MLLALAFAVAGAAKLADRPGSRRAIADFGVPAALATPLGTLLPLAELAVAAALLPSATAWWGALGAFALLLLFAAGISSNLVRGRRPDCHCFGQIHSAPAGYSTLARNGLFAVVAGFVLWQGSEGAGPSALGWLWGLSAGQLAVLLGVLAVLGLVAAQWLFLLNLFRQNGRLLLRLEALEGGLGVDVPSGNGSHAGLPPGAAAPAFGLPSLGGEEITLDALRAPGKPVLLIFTDPGCEPCKALLPEIDHWQREHAAEVTVALLTRGTAEENRSYGVERVLLQKDREVAEAYGADGTPSAVLVRPDGTVGSAVAAGSEAVTALFERVLAHDDVPEGTKVGEPAPEITLPNLSGEDVSLTDFGGENVLVLFWSTGCGFCDRMLDDLKAWEAAPPEGAPKLLVISDGTVEANEIQGLRSPVLLDRGFDSARAFGAPGTPAAVLVDASGKVASGMALGGKQVLALAGSALTARS